MLAYAALIGYSAIRVWRATSETVWRGSSATRSGVRVMLSSFILTAYPAMIHYTLQRDRGFMLLIGMAVGICDAAERGHASPWGMRSRVT